MYRQRQKPLRKDKTHQENNLQFASRNWCKIMFLDWKWKQKKPLYFSTLFSTIIETFVPFLEKMLHFLSLSPAFQLKNWSENQEVIGCGPSKSQEQILLVFDLKKS